MTRTEYMKLLQEKLQRYNIAVEQEILEDYEQHFTEGLAQGHSEEEIIRELGNIEDMLQEFSEEDLKQEMAAVELQASQSNSYEQLYQRVVIDGLIANVEVCPSEDSQLRIDYENRGSKSQKLRYYFYQYDKDGVFYAGVTDRKIADAGGDLFGGLFSHTNWSCDEIDLRIEIPAGIREIQLRTTSGDLHIRGIQTGELRTQCASGDQRIEGSNCGGLNAGTGSGDVEIANVTASHMRVQTGSGDVECYDIRGKELTVVTGSGDADVWADMELYDIKAGSGDLDLTVGTAARQIKMATGSGDICLGLGDVPGASIEARTVSGEVTLPRGNRSAGLNNSFSYYGNGECQVKLATASGDIDVNSAECQQF